jgi:hypothetical protein
MLEHTEPSRRYIAGTVFGPFSMKGETLEGVSRFIIDLTVENWPTVLPTVCDLEVRWRLLMPEINQNTGAPIIDPVTGQQGMVEREAGANFQVPSNPRERFTGLPRTFVRVDINRYTDPDPRVELIGADFKMTAVQTFRTTITARTV